MSIDEETSRFTLIIKIYGFAFTGLSKKHLKIDLKGIKIIKNEVKN